MTKDQLWPLAVHESGHATAAFVLGALDGAGAVTIQPHGPYAGMCQTGRPGPFPGSPADTAALGGHWAMLTPGMQDYWQKRCVISLAGAAAAALYGHIGAPPAPPEPPAGAKPPPVPAAEKAELDAAADEPPRSDHESVVRFLEVIHHGLDDIEVSVIDRHLAFLEAQARCLLRDDLAQRRIVTLASELLVWETLPAAHWVQTLANVQ